MDICPGRLVGHGYCIVDGKLAKLAGSKQESGGGVEVRISDVGELAKVKECTT